MRSEGMLAGYGGRRLTKVVSTGVDVEGVALSRFCEDARRKIARLLLYGVRDGRTTSEVKQP
jgi:hypothetical protein